MISRAKKKILYICIFSGFLVVTYGMFCVFSFMASEKIVQNNKAHLEEIASRAADSTAQQLEAGLASLKSLASIVGIADDMRSSEVKETVSAIKKQLGLDRLSIADTHGVSFSDAGLKSDVSSERYFRLGVSGQNGIYSNKDYTYWDKSAVEIYTPIYSGNTIKGVVHGTYTVDRLLYHANNLSFEGGGFFHIVKSDGDVIFRSENKFAQLDKDNFFDALKNAKPDSGYSVDRLRTDFNSKSVTTAIFTYQGNKQMFSCAPIGFDDWYCVAVIPFSYVSSYITANSAYIAMALGLVVFVFLVALSFMIMYVSKHLQDLSSSNDELLLITNSISGGVQKFRLDSKCEFEYISDGFLKSFGYSKEEIQKNFDNSMYNTIHPDDVKRVARDIALQKGNRNGMHLEYRMLPKNGGVVWVINKCSVVTDESGVAHCYSVITDISDSKKAEQDLRLSNEKFKIAISHTSDVVFELDLISDTFFCSNIDNATTHGLQPVIQNMPYSLIKSGVIDKEYESTFLNLYNKIKMGQAVVSSVIKTRFKGSTASWSRVTLTNMYDDNDMPIRAVGTFEDITEQREAEMRYQKEESYRSAMLTEVESTYNFNVTKGIFLSGERNHETDSTVEGTRYSDYVQNKIAKNIHPEDKENTLKIMSAESLLNNYANGIYEVNVEYRVMQENGVYRWVMATINLLKDPLSPDVIGFGYIKDINGRKLNELALAYKAERDQLTGVYNRITAEKKIDSYLKTQGAFSGIHAFIIMDLDGFKTVNDTCGHIHGDELLKKTAEKLRDIFRGSDIVGRMGGDEFAIFLKDAGSVNHIMKKASDICRAFDDINVENYDNISITASVGVAVVPEHGDNFTQLYERADEALYIAKRSGKNMFVIYGSDV